MVVCILKIKINFITQYLFLRIWHSLETSSIHSVGMQIKIGCEIIFYSLFPLLLSCLLLERLELEELLDESDLLQLLLLIIFINLNYTLIYLYYKTLNLFYNKSIKNKCNHSQTSISSTYLSNSSQDSKSYIILMVKEQLGH